MKLNGKAFKEIQTCLSQNEKTFLKKEKTFWIVSCQHFFEENLMCK